MAQILSVYPRTEEGFPAGSVVKKKKKKNLLASARDSENGGLILGWEDPLEEEVAIHSSILAGKIPWMEETGRLQSMGLKKRCDWVSTHTYTHTGQKK